ncbi:LysR family transcriptional regulator [Faecalicatena contorta]|uniref:DNA-binding transcriptional regulator, LysR family n=1 Tax=Faecalicatena contorta TaxID=39482 RepID=A0A315ZZX9_9FIRM|nr:LysR family transcriptional regulator [Faecalicatena contorta]PWJ50832.1 DNA-binding transcriptional LysR family regulator [Faecalicatena contorta]SUQ13400.1 DNA-binding transcriptional regulator, LysR family [Faecalicatena contorta]
MNRFIALQKIIEFGSFTKAAEALGYTQSSISQMISSLEDELSIKLLNRSRLGVKLTLEGVDLYPFIERTILQYRATMEKANEIKGLETGVIRIGTLASISCHWMPQLIKEFQILYPNVEFILHQGDYSSIQEWIKVGAVDFGFTTPAAVTGIETVYIKEGRMLAVLPENHKLASNSAVSLEEIANEPFILLEEGHFSEPMEAFHACNLEPNIKFRIHDDYAIMTMVEAGLGISILAELVLRRTNYNIALLPINPPINRTLAIGYKDKSSLPIASKYFIEYLLNHVEMMP